MTVDEKLSALRDAGDADGAWGWIQDLKSQGAKAEDELAELYLRGSVPTGLDGPTDGLLVTTTTNPVLDPAVAALTKFWMPWQGKRFNAAAHTGDNRMTAASATVTKLLWPFYAFKDHGDGKLAFDFKTYQDEGKADPGLQVMVIDYSDVESNPKLIIRDIRDELVELVPGVFLGKILYKLPRDKYATIGYFALRSAQT